MTRRTPTINPELRAHQEWLGYNSDPVTSYSDRLPMVSKE